MPRAFMKINTICKNINWFSIGQYFYFYFSIDYFTLCNNFIEIKTRNGSLFCLDDFLFLQQRKKKKNIVR